MSGLDPVFWTLRVPECELPGSIVRSSKSGVTERPENPVRDKLITKITLSRVAEKTALRVFNLGLWSFFVVGSIYFLPLLIVVILIDKTTAIPELSEVVPRLSAPTCIFS